MIPSLFDNPAQKALEYALDACAMRAQIIGNNISNADTPNYKAQRLRFEDFLAKELGKSDTSVGLELKTTQPEHLPGRSSGGVEGIVTPRGLVYTEERTTYRLDGNNIDIDLEMAEQAKNALMYSTLTELVSRRLAGLRTVISEGSR